MFLPTQENVSGCLLAGRGRVPLPADRAIHDRLTDILFLCSVFQGSWILISALLLVGVQVALAQNGVSAIKIHPKI